MKKYSLTVRRFCRILITWLPRRQPEPFVEAIMAKKTSPAKPGPGRPNATVELIQIGTAVPAWVVAALDESSSAALRTRASEIRLILEAELRRREQHRIDRQN